MCPQIFDWRSIAPSSGDFQHRPPAELACGENLKKFNIFLVYPIRDIRAIKIEIKDGLNPKRNIYLCTNDNRSIPLNPVEQPMALSDLEKKATNLAKFLDVELEGI